jgi:ribose 5-phosphate isomerase RpiB
LIAGARVHVTLSACQIPGVRAAYLADPLSAEQAISRDRANVVALSAHNTNPEAARRLVDLWLHNNRRPQEGERQPSRKVQKAERIDEVYRLLDAVYG